MFNISFQIYIFERMSILTNKYTQILSIHTIFAEYFNKLTNFTTSSNLTLLSIAHDYHYEIDKINPKLEKLISAWLSEITKSLNFKEYSKLAFKLYGIIIRIDELLSKIYKILSKEIDINLESEISTTSSVEINGIFENIIRAYTTYLTHDINDITELLAQSLFKISLKYLSDLPYKIVQKYYRDNDSTIFLYVKFMQQLINYYYKNKLENRHSLELQLEQDKTWQLTQGVMVEDRFKNIKLPINCLISRWNLIPISSFGTLKDILNELFGREIRWGLKETLNKHPQNWSTIVKKLSKLCNESISLIIIVKIAPCVVLHNIDRIVGPKSKQHTLLSGAGVSKQSIEKFTTLNISQGKGKWNISISRHDYILSKDVDWDKFRVIETNGEQYRILSRYKSITVMNRHHISGLLNYIEYRKQIVKSRVTEYNKTLELGIYCNLLSNSKIDLEQLAAQSAYKVDIGSIKQKLGIALMKMVDKLLKKYNPSNFSSLRDILYNPDLAIIFTEAQIEIYQSGKLSKPFNLRNILDSFLYDLDENSKMFNRELTNAFTLVIKDYKETSKNITYRSIADKVIAKTLDAIMTRENNVFQNIAFKIDMLTHLK